ncbi:MAG: mannose-1-phosphate guanylyltransferase/mannose-6-phosphate isomerase [Xanthobacteraceae bacterium]
MADRIRPVILSGGAGTRLWPASRDSLPKQFLKLLGPHSTLQEAIKRVADRALFDKPIIITQRDYRFLVREQLEEIAAEAEIVLEPVRRDSGPAVAAVTGIAAADRPDVLVLVLAADHVVREPTLFVAAIRAARTAAQTGRIVTFGIKPDHAATGYGYIRPGTMLDDAAPAHAIEAFVEKPDAATAVRYIANGYLWNSGNFLFRADIFLAEYAAFEPKSAEAVARSIANATTDLGFRILDADAFSAAERKSVDFAVMEKTKRGAVVPADYGWSDVGGWNAVWNLSERDARGNAVKGEVLLFDTEKSYVASNSGIAALLGVENLIVIVEDDAVLVATRDRAEELRPLVERLRKLGKPQADSHSRVHRPWGTYQAIDQGERFQVKRIVVKPGGRLSLQKHQHRAEHWVVVRGMARVTIGDEVRDLQENESVDVPIGAVHRLENPGKIPLELIEVQTGAYLGEDDIIRLDDDYHRKPGD